MMQMCQKTESSLVQVMAYCLFGTKLLPEAKMTKCWLKPFNILQGNLNQNMKSSFQVNAFKKSFCSSLNGLTHWGRGKMAAVSQTTLSNAFSWMKMYEFRLRFHWILFPGGPINNIPALVQIMARRRPGDKPLPEPMVVSLPTHICVARPHWVNAQNMIYLQIVWWTEGGAYVENFMISLLVTTVVKKDSLKQVLPNGNDWAQSDKYHHRYNAILIHLNAPLITCYIIARRGMNQFKYMLMSMVMNIYQWNVCLIYCEDMPLFIFVELGLLLWIFMCIAMNIHMYCR